MKHFVVIEHMAYEGSQLYGVFDSINEALEFIKHPPPDVNLSYTFPEIEVWENGTEFVGLNFDEVRAQIQK